MEDVYEATQFSASRSLKLIGLHLQQNEALHIMTDCMIIKVSG